MKPTALRGAGRAGFAERDIWDIAAIASFYDIVYRVASASDLQSNPEHHTAAR